MVGGLNLLSKLLGKPGKMSVQGDMVYQLHLAGKAQEINDYCMFDTLDTFFVFLRTRMLTGEMTLEEEHIAVLKAKEWLKIKSRKCPRFSSISKTGVIGFRGRDFVDLEVSTWRRPRKLSRAYIISVHVRWVQIKIRFRKK